MLWRYSVQMTLLLSRGIENRYKIKHVPISEVAIGLDISYYSGISPVGVLKLVCGSFFICFTALNCAKKCPFAILFTIFILQFQKLCRWKNPLFTIVIWFLYFCDYLSKLFWLQKNGSHLFCLLGYYFLTSRSAYLSTQEN